MVKKDSSARFIDFKLETDNVFIDFISDISNQSKKQQLRFYKFDINILS